MATDRLFSSMLNQVPIADIIVDELMKRDYVMQKVNHDKSWRGGDLVVPIQGQFASSIQFGALTDASDIADYKYFRGLITSQPEVWGTMKMNERDLFQNQGGKIPEQTFLKMLPNQVDSLVMYFKSALSAHLLSGGEIDTVTVDGTVGGVLEVASVDRFTKDQKIVVDDDNSAPLTVYVIAIDVNAGTLGEGQITVSLTRGGAAADVSAYTVAQNAKLYHPGAQTAGMTSLGSQLLSAANGGASSQFGLVKADHVALQSIQIDGTAVSATNILTKIFDGYSKRQRHAKSGKIPEVLVSYKHMGSILKIIEASKGGFNVVPNSRSASQYGWNSISIGSVTGELLTITAIQQMPNNLIYYLDWDGITFYSNDLIHRRKDPGDGKEFYTVRATTGFVYLVDFVCAGDLVVTELAKQAVMYGIPNY